MTNQDLKNLILDKIPVLSGFLFEVESHSARKVIVSAKLKDHLNHKDTAFGGSLYQLGLLAGYALFLNLLLQEQESIENLVIAHGEIDYLAAAQKDLTAVCEVTPDQINDFRDKLKNKSRGSLILAVHISCDDLLVAKLKCRFVHRR